MSKADSTRYVCSECGYTSTKWLGKCPQCGVWNTFSEETVSQKALAKGDSCSAASVSLDSVPSQGEFRFESGIAELDRVLGGGIVNSSSVLVGGEPGIGKSTLMLQMASMCSSRRSVLYISGEESASQVKQRAQRLGLDLKRISILCNTKCEEICHVLMNEKPQVAVIDSLQTLEGEDSSSAAGSVSQMRNCCLEITNTAKASGTSVFFIGHVTKEGTIAGPKIIEHMVDTVVYFELVSSGVRLIRAAKNRFGSVDEIGIFTMSENGLEGVKDPSSFFISQREDDKLPPGIAFTSIVEGSRTFLVEIQALVVEAKSGYTRVYSDRIESSRVTKIAAILERHAGVRLSDKDIYINVAGGVKVNEVAVELALAMALFSAAANVILPSKTVCFGELSLAGEVRPVSFPERRLKAAAEMGFDRAVASSGTKTKTGIVIAGCKKIKDAVLLPFEKC